MTEARTPEELEHDDLPPIEDDPKLDGTGGGGPAPDRALRPDGLEHDGNGLHGADPVGSGTAGGVILVKSARVGPRIAVMESGGLSSLPKAEVGEGMSVETAALDAALAFTGLAVRLEEAIGETDEFIDGVHVTTWFWLARPARTVLGDAAGPTATGFALHWLPVEEALEVLSSPAERALVERIRTRAIRARKPALVAPGAAELAADLEAFRDRSAAEWRDTDDPAQLDALLRAREEIERAEERLDRGDDAGARRARARAERATFSALDEEGRALALRRELDRAPERLRPALTAAVPTNGHASVELLTAVHSAVEAARDEDERAEAASRAAQAHVTLALGATAAAVLAGAFFGLFRTVPRPVLDPAVAAAVFLASGALGVWVGEALGALRSRGRGALSLPLAAAAGALAGLVLGAFLTGGLGDTLLEDAALTLSATFAAGWLVRTFLPRG
ncbi:MAG: hypothetical protein AAFR54_05470 [Planctomycetota bacterium]